MSAEIINHPIHSVHFRPRFFIAGDSNIIRSQLNGLLPDWTEDLLTSGINTDTIIPADACKDPSTENLAKYALTGWENGLIMPGDLRRIAPDVIVGGPAFGSGSSREHAPIALNAAGINLVIAPCFSPIFRRNATNMGMHTSTDFRLIGRIKNGEAIPVEELIRDQDPISQSLLRSGGLLPFLEDIKTGKISRPEISTGERPMTIAEKWLSHFLHVPFVKPGDGGLVSPDSGYSYEYTAPVSIGILHEHGGATFEVVNPESLILFNDHLSLDNDSRSVVLQDTVRNFAKTHGIRLIDTFVTPEDMSICHILMLRNMKPGMHVGTDSHTPMTAPTGGFVLPIGATDFAGLMLTGEVLVSVPESVRINLTGLLPPYVSARDLMLYLSASDKSGKIFGNRVMEFGGEGLQSMSLEQLSVIANASAECRAVTAVLEPSPATAEALTRNGRASDLDSAYAMFPLPDADAQYSQIITVDLNLIQPHVALPGKPENGIPLSQLPETTINRVSIGACVGGGIEDMRITAKILSGKQVNPNVRLTVHPNSYAVLKQAEAESLLTIIQAAGGEIIREIGCGECVGNGPGKLNKNDMAITNQSRNHNGRMGDPSAQVYLAGTYICAATAILGHTPSIQDLNQLTQY